MGRKSKQSNPAPVVKAAAPPLAMPAAFERWILALVFAATTAMLTWMARPLLTGQIPTTGDLFHFHYPLRDFYARALSAGQQFEWMPSLFGGFYVVGEGQLGAYHPLHWLVYRLLPLDAAFAIELVAAYPFLFAGMWLFLRRWCQPAPAALGAMLFTFSSFNLSHAWHMNLVAVVAHLPWLLLAIHVAMASAGWRGRMGACAAIGLLTGSQLLLGHPQAVWLCGLIEVAYTLMLLPISGRHSRLWGVVSVVAGKLLGVGIGAIQLLATLDAARQSLRAEQDASFATAFSLPPARLLELLHPYLFRERIVGWSGDVGDEFSVYGGAVPLVLAAWWLARYSSLRAAQLTRATDRFGLCALALGILGLWLATGSYGGLYYLQTWLPLVGQFRSPSRYVLFAQLALAVVGVVSLARLGEQPQPGQSSDRRTLWAPWSVAVASASLALLTWLSAGQRATSLENTLAVVLGPVLFIAGAGLLTLATRSVRWALPGLVLLAALDLALYGLGGVVAWQRIAPRDEALRRQELADPLPPRGAGRIVRGEMDSVYVLFDRRMLDGYAGVVPVRKLNYLSLPALRVAQVQYVHSVFQDVARIPGAQLAEGEWYRLPAPLLRARLVTQSRVSRQPDLDLERLDVERAALATRELGLAGGEVGTAEIVQDDPGEIRVRTNALSRQLLVVSESFHDGWIAQIGGQPAPVEQINGDFLGCVVEAGNHEVTLQFSPAHLALGKAISLCGLAAAVALAAMAAARRW